MKKHHLLYLFVVIFLAGACKTDNIIPSSAIGKETRTLTSFNSLTIENGLETSLTIGTSEKVEIEANENILSSIETIQVGDKVTVKVKEGVSFVGSPTIRIAVSAKNLSAITLSGGSKFTSTRSFSTTALALTLSGGSIATLKANVGASSLVFSGGSKTSGFELVADDCTINASGGSEINVTVNKKLDVTASGGSMVNYRGAGVVGLQNLSGGSVVVKR